MLGRSDNFAIRAISTKLTRVGRCGIGAHGGRKGASTNSTCRRFRVRDELFSLSHNAKLCGGSVVEWMVRLGERGAGAGGIERFKAAARTRDIRLQVPSSNDKLGRLIRGNRSGEYVGRKSLPLCCVVQLPEVLR